ncbi:MAG TPA: aminotransferase class I/II-fold pyridoxal phosphate-dependent enzyme [Candidatus Obscuribacterales bacterium]
MKKNKTTASARQSRWQCRAAAPAVPPLETLLGSDDVCLAGLEQLLAALDAPDLRTVAVGRLHELAVRLEQGGGAALKLDVVSLPGGEEPIRLLLHAAVFSPEHWGRTFAEGLLKDPGLFDGRRVVELGTGSGWISLLLLSRTRAAEVLGLDINPIAVLLARLNAWLNGTTSDGELRMSQAGVPVPKAFRALESDLFEQPLASGETFDHVIGCIPQVLHPHPAGKEGARRRLSDQELYDLSNYCFEQGILEDRFGLPLIARALEQSQLCLRPGGQVTLILGGRPGPGAIDSMFLRRGFDSELVWSRRIRQADDTDLASLVKLEEAHGIHFHFFMSMTSAQPIPASTAVRLLEAGRPVFHDLLVYRARTRFEQPTTGFLKNLHAMGLTSLRRELDFSRISEEQIGFLQHFSSRLLQARTLPYPHERGDISLRKRLAEFLNVYCHHSVGPGRLFVGPERAQLLALVLAMVARPGRTVLLSRGLEPVYRAVCEQAGLEVVVGNDDLPELVAVEEVSRPILSLLAPVQLDQASPLVLDALCRLARENPDRWYMVDGSAHLDISSNLSANVFSRLLSTIEMPPNLVLVYGLVKNTVCPDLELSFMLNTPGQWLHGLEVGAELTYSRISFLAQAYYEWLFDELLAFPFQEKGLTEMEPDAGGSMNFADRFSAAAADPVFYPKPVSPGNEHLIRLDYGELEAPVPDLLVKGVIKGLLEAPVERLPDLVTQRVQAYLKRTRGVHVAPERIVLGQGVFPLLGAMLRSLARRLGRPPVVALPNGSYGPLYPMVRYHGGISHEVATDPARGFQLDPETIKGISPKPDILWLTQPANPSGLFMEPDAVRAIVRACAEREIYVLSDEIFFLLSDSRLGDWTPPSLSFAYFLDAKERKWLFLADGISKAFAAGGLRCGFMVCPDEKVAAAVQSGVCLPPKSALRAWDTLYSSFLDESPHELMDVTVELGAIQHYLHDTRKLLDSQRKRLLSLLREHGLDDGLETHYRGGLFLLARLADRAGALAKEALLLVNAADWSRTPGWSRLCYSLRPDRFETAMTRLEKFLRA